VRKITCPCDQVFSVDIPETVNLDSSEETIARIENGSFLSCVCPSCNSVLHTDLRTRFEWPSKKTNILLIPEMERIAFLSGNLETDPDAETVIGFAELADRVSALKDGLEPLAVEAVKYHLATKARSTSPSSQLTILYERKRENGDLEFHIHGLKTDEVAVTVIPPRVYDGIVKDIGEHPDGEPYASLRNGSYLSIQNILIEDGPND